MRLRKILVETDFSEASTTVVEAGFDLAQQSGSLLYLMHVIPSPVEAEAVVETISPPVPKHYRMAMEGLEKALREHHDKPVRVQRVVAQGRPAKQIVEFAGQNDVDLIIVGAPSRKRLARVLLRSAAETVLREAPCHVLIVKRKMEPGVVLTAAAAFAVPDLEC